MACLHNKRLPIWSLILILLAASGSVAYVFVTALGHSNNHPSTPDFTMTPSPSSQGIYQGQSGTIQITTTSLAGFTGTVGLSMTITPSVANTITASIGQNTISLAANKGNSTTINLSTTNAAMITYNIVVVGTSGSLSHQATVSVTVLSTSRCTPGYICPGGADPLSIAVSQDPSTFQVYGMSIWNYATYQVSVYDYYYTAPDKSQMSSEYTVNVTLSSNSVTSFPAAQPGVQVYGATVLWQTPPPPPTYTQNSQLNQSWAGMTQVSREQVYLENYAFTSSTNVTLDLRNTGTSTVTLTSYTVTDSAGDRYTQNNWIGGPTINVNAVGIAYITIGQYCPTCTLTGNAFTFTVGSTYIVTVITSRNNQFPNSIMR